MYAGKEQVQLCRCDCEANTAQIPVIVYAEGQGAIKREQVHALSPPEEGKITGYCVSGVISEGDARRGRYVELLRLAGLEA